MIRKFSHVALLALVFLAAFTATAFAATAAAPSDGTWLDALRPVFDAVVGGNYFAAAALALVAVTALVSKYGKGRFPWLASGPAKAALVLIGSFGGALGTAAMGGAAFSLALLWTAVKVAIAAAGGYSLLKELLGAIAPHLPSWMQPIVRAVRALFDRPDPAVQVAAAGEAAVVAKPSTGITGVIKTPKTVK